MVTVVAYFSKVTMCGENDKLRTLVKKMSGTIKLYAYLKCANVMAIDRMVFTDHGPMYVKIVANSALRILRILIKKGITPNIKNYVEEFF